MKIHLMSDLHLGFYNSTNWFKSLDTNPKEDILVLAGDIQLSSECFKTDFFSICSKKYFKVLYVLGNHEFYGNTIDGTKHKIESLKTAYNNIILLDNNIYITENTVFVGSTLWCNFNKENPVSMSVVKRIVNDYKHIRLSEKNDRCITTQDVLALFKESFKYLKEVIKQNKDKDVVVITHFAPSFLSVGSQFKDEFHINGNYASDLSYFILNNPQIKIWMHGHIHEPKRYMIGDTLVISNPKGYPYENGYDYAPIIFDHTLKEIE